jgi:hypothetical protein
MEQRDDLFEKMFVLTTVLFQKGDPAFAGKRARSRQQLFYPLPRQLAHLFPPPRYLNVTLARNALADQFRNSPSLGRNLRVDGKASQRRADSDKLKKARERLAQASEGQPEEKS